MKMWHWCSESDLDHLSWTQRSVRKPAQLTTAHLSQGLREESSGREVGTHRSTLWSTALPSIQTLTERRWKRQEQNPSRKHYSRCQEFKKMKRCHGSRYLCLTRGFICGAIVHQEGTWMLLRGTSSGPAGFPDDLFHFPHQALHSLNKSIIKNNYLYSLLAQILFLSNQNKKVLFSKNSLLFLEIKYFIK